MNGMVFAARDGLASLWQFVLMLATFYAGPWWRLFGAPGDQEGVPVFGGVAPRDGATGFVQAHLAGDYLAAVSPVWLAAVPVGDVAALMSQLGAMERYELTCDNPEVVEVLPGHGAETDVGHCDLWPVIENDGPAALLGYAGECVLRAHVRQAWEWVRCPKGRARVSVVRLERADAALARRALRWVWPDGAVIVVATMAGELGETELVRELRAAPVDPPTRAPDVPAAPADDYDPAADRARMRGIVASALDAYDLSPCSVLMVRRGILDDEAFRALAADCLDIDSTAGRELVLAWLTDLRAGRHDRIERSDTVWCRTQCVACGTDAFYLAAEHCERCAKKYSDARELVLRDVADTMRHEGWHRMARLLLNGPTGPDLDEVALVIDAAATRVQARTQHDVPVWRGAATALRELARGRDASAVHVLAQREGETDDDWLRAAREARDAGDDCDTNTTEAM